MENNIPEVVLPPPPNISIPRATWRAIKPKDDINVSQWAEKHRFVTTGPLKDSLWSNELTPYLVEPMNTWCEPWVRKIYLCFAPQTGKTSVAINCLLYSIDQDPGPAMYVMANEKTAKRISHRQLIPTIKASPRTNSLLSGRADDTSTYYVQFTNGMDLMLAWATSAAAMASESIKYLFLDEPGKYPLFTGREADPFSLAEVRMNTFQHTSKEMVFSTPNISGDPFDNHFNGEPDEIRALEAKCPFCGFFQVMTFDNIHWPDRLRDPRVVLRKKLAKYGCVQCGMEWDDYYRNKAVTAGRWRAEKPVNRPTAVGFGPLPSWYSPFVSMSQAAAAFLKGLEDRSKFMAFVTQHKAEPWKEVVEQKDELKVLENRTTFPPMVVPPEVKALTAGIDVQKVGFWFVVRGWEADLTSHLIFYGYLTTFEDVEKLAFATRFTKANSTETLGIWRAAMDTGGGVSADSEWTRTEEIYMWLRANGRNLVHGVKGASTRQLKKVNPRIIDKLSSSKKTIPGGLQLMLLETNQFKDTIHWRMTRREDETQRFLLHSETGMDYVQQLLAEEKRRNRTNGKTEWIKTRKDNHYLDCEVMAAACVDPEWLPSFKMGVEYQAALDKKLAGPGPKPAPAKTLMAGPDFHRPAWLNR